MIISLPLCKKPPWPIFHLSFLCCKGVPCSAIVTYEIRSFVYWSRSKIRVTLHCVVFWIMVRLLQFFIGILPILEGAYGSLNFTLLILTFFKPRKWTLTFGCVIRHGVGHFTFLRNEKSSESCFMDRGLSSTSSRSTSSFGFFNGKLGKSFEYTLSHSGSKVRVK